MVSKEAKSPRFSLAFHVRRSRVYVTFCILVVIVFLRLVDDFRQLVRRRVKILDQKSSCLMTKI